MALVSDPETSPEHRKGPSERRTVQLLAAPRVVNAVDTPTLLERKPRDGVRAGDVSDSEQ